MYKKVAINIDPEDICFKNLPLELLCQVLSSLDSENIVNIARTNRAFRTAAIEVAKNRIKEEFKLPELARRTEINHIRTLELLLQAASYFKNVFKHLAVVNQIEDPAEADIAFKRYKVSSESVIWNSSEVRNKSKKHIKDDTAMTPKVLAGIVLMNRRVVPNLNLPGYDKSKTVVQFLGAIEQLLDADCANCIKLDENNSPSFIHIPEADSPDLAPLNFEGGQREQSSYRLKLMNIKANVDIGHKLYKLFSMPSMSDEQAIAIFDELDTLNPSILIQSALKIKEEIIIYAIKQKRYSLALQLSLKTTEGRPNQNPLIARLCTMFFRMKQSTFANTLMQKRFDRTSLMKHEELTQIELEKAKNNCFDPDILLWKELAVGLRHEFNHIIALHICELIKAEKFEYAKQLRPKMIDAIISKNLQSNGSDVLGSFNRSLRMIIVEYIKCDKYSLAMDELFELSTNHPDYSRALVEPIALFIEKKQTAVNEAWFNYFDQQVKYWINAIEEAAGKDDEAKIDIIVLCMKKKLYDDAIAISQSIPSSSENYNRAQKALAEQYIINNEYQRALDIFKHINWTDNDSPYHTTSVICRMFGLFDNPKKATTQEKYEWIRKFSETINTKAYLSLITTLLDSHCELAVELSEKIDNLQFLEAILSTLKNRIALGFNSDEVRKAQAEKLEARIKQVKELAMDE